MESRLKAAIVGFGLMGQRHAANLSQREDVVIAGICDREAETARGTVREKLADDVPVFEDLRRMLDETRPDMIYVCLPPFAHTDEVELAASRGVHLFIEKPIALTTQQARSMADAVKAAGVVSQVGYHMHFGTAVRSVKSLIEDGSAGRPTLFTASYECNSLHAPWWRDMTKSGGQVLEQLIHLYDMAIHLLGTPTQVSGLVANLAHAETEGYTADDTSASVVRFESGAIAAITGSNCAVPGQWNARFTIVCERLTAHFSSPNDAVIAFTAESPVRSEEIHGDADMYAEETGAFIAAVKEGRSTSAIPIAEGYLGLQLVESVLASSRGSGASVRIVAE